MTILIKQRFDGDVQRKDCFLCCIAMLLDFSYDQVYKKLSTFIENEIFLTRGPIGNECDQILSCFELNRLQIGARSVTPTINDGNYLVLYIMPQYTSINFLRNILWGRRSLIQVKSKNYLNEMHIVYWDGHELFDPSNKLTYTWEEVEPIYLWLFDEESV